MLFTCRTTCPLSDGLATESLMSQQQLNNKHHKVKHHIVTSSGLHCRCQNSQGDVPMGPLVVDTPVCTRRDLMILATSGAASTSFVGSSKAVQGLTAGRIPGVTGPDTDGFYRYTRPEGKSGGHGVGWSEIPRYTFKVPEGWDEKPVSIADLGGTEIDLRFENPEQGNLLVVVAPVLRFMDVGYNASIDIEQIGPPDKIIAGFAPELYGKPLMEDDVFGTGVVKDGGLTYYQWQVKPHHLVSATAVGNRLFILSTTSNSRQWRKAKDDLIQVQESFRVLQS